jgi:hypothetical protein
MINNMYIAKFGKIFLKMIFILFFVRLCMDDCHFGYKQKSL